MCFFTTRPGSLGGGTLKGRAQRRRSRAKARRQYFTTFTSKGGYQRQRLGREDVVVVEKRGAVVHRFALRTLPGTRARKRLWRESKAFGRNLIVV